MNSPTTSRARRRATLFRRFGWLAVAGMTTLALVGPAAGPVAATHTVTPITSQTDSRLAGNPGCYDSPGQGTEGLEDWYGNGQLWLEAKLNATPSVNATVVVAQGTITINTWNAATGTFTWSSNFGIDAMFIKTGGGGGGYNVLYVYAPTAGHAEAFSGTGVSDGPTAISHVTWCYDAANPDPSPSPSPSPSPASSISSEPSCGGIVTSRS